MKTATKKKLPPKKAAAPRSVFTVSQLGYYRTRDGTHVIKVVTIDPERTLPYPVWGMVVGERGHSRWSYTGHFIYGLRNPWDLVEFLGGLDSHVETTGKAHRKVTVTPAASVKAETLAGCLSHPGPTGPQGPSGTPKPVSGPMRVNGRALDTDLQHYRILRGALLELAGTDFNPENCANLAIASARVRCAARAALTSTPAL